MNLNNMQLDKQKKILIVIFIILIVYVDMNFILKAQTAGINNLNPKINRLQNDLKNLNRDLANMRASAGKESLATQKATARSAKIISESQVNFNSFFRKFE